MGINKGSSAPRRPPCDRDLGREWHRMGTGPLASTPANRMTRFPGEPGPSFQTGFLRGFPR